MPMQFGKMTIETPQEVLARLQQERRAMSASGNVAAIQQATLSNSLDALFGNPEVKQAQAIQSRMQMAQQSVKPEEGDDDVTSEMKRISAMRDAVQDVSPDLANEMTTQLLQLGTIRQERAKLQAQTALAQNKDKRGDAELGIRAAEAAAKIGASGLTATRTQQEIDANAGKGINYWRRNGSKIEHVALPEGDSLERRKMLATGWLEGTGPTSEAEASSIVNPTKPVMTDLQTAYLQSQDQMSSLSSIAQKFDPAFLKLPNQLLMKGRAGLEKLGVKLPADQAAQLDRYTEFKRNSVDAFNRYIKFITGAQMAVAEAERIQKGFPDAENDSPTQFVSKMRETARQILGVQRRTAQAVQHGLQIGPDQMEACKSGKGPCVWDSIQMPSVSDQEVDQFLGRFGLPARASAAPDKNGYVTTRSGARVKELK